MAEFPNSIPSDRQSSTTEYLSNMAGGFGHVALHNFHNNEIIALATKLGTGSSTAASGTLLRGTGNGASGWGPADLTTDVTGILPITSGGTGAGNATNARSNLDVYSTTQTNTAIQALYPVGSIYINATSSTNPGTLLGFGTWTAFGAGRVMVGLSSSDTDFDTAEETGGEKTHTLVDSEMPMHSHSITYGGADAAGSSGITLYRHDTGSNLSRTTSTAGSGGAHNNLQPYIVVYMWKRTA